MATASHALHALGQHLTRHGIEVGYRADHLALSGGACVECKPRPTDADRMWFHLDDNPIGQADLIMDTAIAIADRIRQQA